MSQDGLRPALADHPRRALGGKAHHRSDRQSDRGANRFIHGIHPEPERHTGAAKRSRGEGQERHPRLQQQRAGRRAQDQCRDHRAAPDGDANVAREAIGDLRFETDGAWKRSGSTVDQLAKELRLALQYPEGAMV